MTIIRTRLVLATALLVLALMLALASLSAPYAAADSPSPTPTPATTPTPSYPPNAAPGVPAITPEPAMRAHALAATATYSTTATYTAADVRAFLTAHNLFRTTDGSPITVTILFIPASQASALIGGDSVGRPDTTLVCYVSARGNFPVMHSEPAGTRFRHSVSRRTHSHARDTTVLPEKHYIFDAQTGNLLVFGYYY